MPAPGHLSLADQRAPPGGAARARCCTLKWHVRNGSTFTHGGTPSNWDTFSNFSMNSKHGHRMPFPLLYIVPTSSPPSSLGQYVRRGTEPGSAGTGRSWKANSRERRARNWSAQRGEEVRGEASLGSVVGAPRNTVGEVVERLHCLRRVRRRSLGCPA